jgi:hypothetical protein
MGPTACGRNSPRNRFFERSGSNFLIDPAGVVAHSKAMETEAPTIHEQVATVASELAGLTVLLETPESKAAAAALQSSWAKLLEHLDLPPVAQTRSCPKCRKLVMRDVTLCGYCWTALGPSH